MKDDRKEICRIISEMLDNPGECEIYPTAQAYDKLEKLVESARIEGAGWAYADACVKLDRGEDPRQSDCAEIPVRLKSDFDKEDFAMEEKERDCENCWINSACPVWGCGPYRKLVCQE